MRQTPEAEPVRVRQQGTDGLTRTAFGPHIADPRLRLKRRQAPRNLRAMAAASEQAGWAARVRLEGLIAVSGFSYSSCLFYIGKNEKQETQASGHGENGQSRCRAISGQDTARRAVKHPRTRLRRPRAQERPRLYV